MSAELAHDLSGPDGAPVLVLLHSVGTSRQSWSALVGPLSEYVRVLRVDARGHGDSPVGPDGAASIDDLGRDVLSLLDRLGLDRVDLAGVSLGGMTALWLAARHPARVRTATLLGTSAHPGDAEAWTTRAAAVRRDGIVSIADAVVERWLTPRFAADHPDAKASLRAQLCRTDEETYARCCDLLSTLDLRGELPLITAPTLVIGGRDDVALPPDPHSRVIVDAVVGSRFVELPAAHIPVVEVPGVVTGLLLDHLGVVRTSAAGLRTRRAVLGDEHVDAAIAGTTSFTADFQDFMTRYAWGEAWARPGLVRRDRSIATLATLVALGVEHEIGMHVRAAIRNGLTRDEVAEILLNTAIYSGLPRANRAFAIAQDVLQTMEDKCELAAEPPPTPMES